jgi:hypothetical protein
MQKSTAKLIRIYRTVEVVAQEPNRHLLWDPVILSTAPLA